MNEIGEISRWKKIFSPPYLYLISLSLDNDFNCLEIYNLN